MAQLRVHSFYRVFFTWIDPLVVAGTVCSLLYDPALMLDALVPSSITTVNPDQACIFHQLAALYGFVGLMLGCVLRVTSDIKVWRAVVGAVLLLDLAIIASTYFNLVQQDRLALDRWRPEDWANVVFTSGVAIVRGLFLLDFGNGPAIKEQKRA